MALTTTTLAAAAAADDNVITVAASTSLSAGYFIRVDDEVLRIVQSYTVAGNGVTVPVIRGQMGTKTAAHASGANAVHGPASDFANPGTATTTPYVIAGRTRSITSYSASGAITLPTPGTDAVAILNGTSVRAMTIADPSKDMDGCALIILSNGTAAHTLTFASGIGGEGSSYDVLTQNNAGPCAYVFYACNGFWLMPVAPAITGTVTNITAALA